MSISHELSQEEIEKLANRRITVITAANKEHELANILNDPRQITIPYLVHYQTSDNLWSIQGHWACMIINKKQKVVYWFDSYGIFPDDEINYIDPRYRRMTNQNKRYVGQFLYELSQMGYQIRYNNIQLQSFNTSIATCGRYCGLFIRSQPLSIAQSGGLTPEGFVSYLNKFHPNKYLHGYDDIITMLSKKIIGI
jgi:hypothetical protein